MYRMKEVKLLSSAAVRHSSRRVLDCSFLLVPPS
jgi:hypothetical protein